MSSRQNSNPARLALAFALAGMAMSSCETGKKLADFGPVKLDSFGTGAVPTATSPASPSQTAARPPAVISSTDPVVMMARAQAAGGNYRPAPQSAPPAPSTVAYQPGPTAPSFSTLDSAEALKSSIPKQFVVKTTAYSHLEADSLQYGTKSALGDDLKFGRVRSAAADWSRYPVGTKFKIKGLPYEYVVDDYGRALVGTDTIDLYKPNLGMMDQWGARNVGIEVLEWGSFEESKRILEGRKHKPDADHVRKMLNNIEQKIKHLPEVLRDGFRA